MRSCRVARQTELAEFVVRAPSRPVAAARRAAVTSIQLHASHDTWHRRFGAGPDRPDVSEFYRNRYEQAQTTQPIMSWTPTG